MNETVNYYTEIYYGSTNGGYTETNYYYMDQCGTYYWWAKEE